MQEEILRAFVRDPHVENAVFGHLIVEFERDRQTKDVNVLAAERLAVLMLREAWCKLDAYRNGGAQQASETGNVGL